MPKHDTLCHYSLREIFAKYNLRYVFNVILSLVISNYLLLSQTQISPITVWLVAPIKKIRLILVAMIMMTFITI